MASVVLLAAIAGCILAALRGPRWWRAAAFGAATAVTAAFGAALTKAITGYLDQGWSAVFTHFQPYMLAVTGLGTVFLLQNALHAGPITASRTTLVTLNPLVSIVLGVTLFGDVLRGGALWIALEVLALAVLVVGVVVLTRSPLVAGSPDGGRPTTRCWAAPASGRMVVPPDRGDALTGRRSTAGARPVGRPGSGRRRVRRTGPRSGRGPPGRAASAARATGRAAGRPAEQPVHAEQVVAQLGAHGPEQVGGHPGVPQGAVVVVPASAGSGRSSRPGGPCPAGRGRPGPPAGCRG